MNLIIDPDYILDVGTTSNRRDMNDAIEALSFRARKCRVKMRDLRKQLVGSEKMDTEKLVEFQKLNDQLRGIEIWKANMKYHMNLL